MLDSLRLSPAYGHGYGDLGTLPTALPGGSTPLRSVGGQPARRVHLKGPETYVIPRWRHQSDPSKIKTIRRISEEYARDPRISELAVSIFRADGVKARDYWGQAASMLRWVQRHVTYVNEKGEILRSPEYVLRVRFGDCDDMAMLLASMCMSLNIPIRYVLVGRGRNGKRVRWIEGQRPKRAQWSHIYLAVGRPAFKPTEWAFMEPTLQVPFGWDVVSRKGGGRGAMRASGGATTLPELSGYLGAMETTTQKTTLVELNRPNKTTRERIAYHLAKTKEAVGREFPLHRIAVLGVGLVGATVARYYLMEYLERSSKKK